MAQYQICHMMKGSRAFQKKSLIRYHFDVDATQIQLCKEYYLSTLDISQRRVSYFHEHMKQSMSEVPRCDRRRCHKGNRKYTVEQLNFVRKHILLQSFPRVESHYCRANTRKEYLEPGLTLVKMFEMYEEKSRQKEKVPVTLHMYRTVLNMEYNIAFHMPKPDRCDLYYSTKVNHPTIFQFKRTDKIHIHIL